MLFCRFVVGVDQKLSSPISIAWLGGSFVTSNEFCVPHHSTNLDDCALSAFPFYLTISHTCQRHQPNTHLHPTTLAMRHATTVKRALLCLVLLVLHASPTGSKTANISLDEEVVKDATVPLVKQLDDGRFPGNDDEDVAASRKIATAFLRKNTKPAKQGGGVKGSREILSKALHRAIGGGVPGAIAGVIQVLSLMWLVSLCCCLVFNGSILCVVDTYLVL